MAKVATQEGLIDTDRMQDVPSSYDEGDRGSPDDIRGDIYDAVDKLKSKEVDDAAEDGYIDTVVRSKGRVADALPQTQDFINGARQNPILAAQALGDHYQALPRALLYQKPAEEPKYDHPDEHENIRRAIQWSIQREEHKQERARQRAASADARKAFRDQHGNDTAAMYQSITQLHQDMSENPADTAPRLVLPIIQNMMDVQREAQGMANANAEIEQFFEKYPKAQKYRDEMARLLKNSDTTGVNTLEEAAGRAAGLWPIRHSVSSEGHRSDIELDVREARGRHPERPDPPRRRVYSEAEQDVRKAVKDLRGE